MLNVSELINDPDFCQTFTVTRNAGTWTNGRFVTTSSTLSMTGVITQMTPFQINQLPEQDRVSGSINIYTLEKLKATELDQSTGVDGSLGDEVTWKGEQYKVIAPQDRSDFGYYKAHGIRKRGA